jgi:hypothetical protein
LNLKFKFGESEIYRRRRRRRKMAALQAYHLRWNNHQESLLHVFDKLLQAEDFVDVTLSCQGQNIRAHRMVLSACSPLFHDLLREHPAKHPIVILNDVNFADLAILMQFMYKGEADVAAECLDSVLRAAHVLGIKGLGAKQTRAPEEKVCRRSYSLAGSGRKGDEIPDLSFVLGSEYQTTNAV